MQFDNLPSSRQVYLDLTLEIIRKGICVEINKLKRKYSEDIKNQILTERFNIIGTTNEKSWIGAGKENKNKNIRNREDIYFYLNDDNKTRVFYLEGKRLPKAGTKNKEEYVIGISTTGKPSGGIERFKLGIHGNPAQMNSCGMIAYIENKSISEWIEIVNESIQKHFPNDTPLLKIQTKNLTFFQRIYCEIP